MFELTETPVAVEVQESEYQRLLGYPRHCRLEGRARELADRARSWYSENGRPWLYAREVETLELSQEKLHLAGRGFSSKRLRDFFAGAGADSAMLVAVSAGIECEERARQLWQEAKPDEYFFLEIFGSAVVEQLVDLASGRICGWADRRQMAALPHYSPGYAGWEIADQITLWNLIRGIGGDDLMVRGQEGHRLPGELEVLESGMLRPKKSLLAMMGLTRNLEAARRQRRFVPCVNCSLPDCQYRRAPYRSTRPRLEELREPCP